MVDSDSPPTSAPAMAGSRLTRAIVVGFVAGFLSGLFGVGGGILIVPALVMAMHMEQRLAHGTSLAAVLPIALSSLIGYAVEGEVDWPVAVALACGAVAGALIGTHVLHKLPHRTLGWAFALLLIATALRLVLDSSEATGRDDLTIGIVVALVVVGFVTGILAGLLGVGGGIVMVPAMVVLFEITAASAKGTSLAVIIPTAIMGTWRNRKKRNADLPVAVAVGLAGVVSAFAASKISVNLDEELSNVLFAILLTVVALRLAWSLERERRATDSDGVTDVA